MTSEEIQAKLLQLTTEYKAHGEKSFADTFGIKVKSDGNHIIFDYDMINVDWDFAPADLCRGLVLDQASMLPLCIPLIKFWNAGEGRAANIDWSSAKIFEKLDGSMVSRWWSNYLNKFVYSTRRQLPQDIQTNKIADSGLTWQTLIDKCIPSDFSQDRNETCVFEVMSPVNKVVVQHKTYSASLIARRNNITLLEDDVSMLPNPPKSYSFSSIDECKAFADTLNGVVCEGFVVVDKHFNRVKIKGSSYLALHHLKASSVNSVKSLIMVARQGEISEVITYFPEFKPALDAVATIIKDWQSQHEEAYEKIKHIENQKDFALAVLANKLSAPNLLFMVKSGKETSIGNAIVSMLDAQYLKHIKPLVERAGITAFSMHETNEDS